MKSWATGVRVRFLNVRIVSGLDVPDKLIGRALIGRSLPTDLTTVLGTIVRNLPLATRAMRAIPVRVTTVAEGRSSPNARKASATSAWTAFSRGGSTQGSFIKSASVMLRRRNQGLFAEATTNRGSS